VSGVRSIVLLALLAAAPSRASVLTYETNTFDVGGNEHLIVSRDGGTLYADTVRDGILVDPAIGVYERTVDGTIKRIQTVIEYAGGGKNSLCGAGQIVMTPDGRHVYVATSCAQAVRPFARGASGTLVALPPIEHVEGRIDALAGAVAIAISPDGADVYVASDRGEIAAFRRDAASGRLEHRAGMTVGKPPTAIESLVMSPDGTSLYAAQRPVLTGFERTGDAALHVFHRDPATGDLTLLESKRDGADGFVSLARFFSVTISPDGRHVYAGQAYGEPVIVSFDRQVTGRLRATSADVDTTKEQTSSQALAITGDGRIVAVLGIGGLRIFERTPADGRLALVQAFPSVTNGEGTCSFATSLAIDPSDTHLYVGSTNCGILTFRRSCGDGVVDPGEACDDGNRLDADGCDALCRVEPCFECAGVPSACVPADGIPCDDANACAVDTHCLAGVCGGGSLVADDTPCDDGDACSVGDRCVAGSCRAGSAPTCGLCEACDHRFGCIGAIRAGCSASSEIARAKGWVDLRRPTRGGHTLAWKWLGNDYTEAPPGDPTVTTAYTFCVFDQPLTHETQNAHRGRVVAGARIPAGGTCGRRACWRGVGDRGFGYGDARGRNDGVRSVVIQPKGKDNTRVTLHAQSRGELMRDLPVEGPVTAQLGNDAGGCWSTVYGEVDKNTSRRFHAHAGCDDCYDR
jgi:cysteine-rich repeat protein